MSNELVIQNENQIAISTWNRDQIELVKRTICKGASDDQLKLFEHVCKRTGLDPFMKQVYGIMRNGKDGAQMTIQTSIDGLRLIADRTGAYLPGRESTFTYGKDNRIFSATAYIKKHVRGEWHEISATAIYTEYMPAYANDFWKNKPHIMLSKCAEALAIRKAFPAEMSGVYVKEELDQTAIEVVGSVHKAEYVTQIEKITVDQLKKIEMAVSLCSPDVKVKFADFIKKHVPSNNPADLPEECYERTIEFYTKKSVEYQEMISNANPAEIQQMEMNFQEAD